VSASTAPVAPRAGHPDAPLGGSTSERSSRLPDIVADLRSADAAAERARELPHGAVRRLRHAGLLGLRVPTRYGGPGGSARDVLGLVVQIARGSSNVAQALRAHFGFSERLLSNRAAERERRQWFPHVESGVVFGNAITDANGKAPSSADTTVLTDAEGVLRLSGYKFYSTGTLFADVIAVSAVDAQGRDLQAIVPTDRDGVELFDDWDGFGQRMTASGGTRFTNVVVHPEEAITVSDGAHLGHGTGFLQLYLAAVAAGIGLAVADDAVAHVRDRARPAAHSLATTAAGDPFVLEAVGEIAADASAAARALNLDRHWRNARTVASHSPLAYKAHATGNYLVNGTWPPANGYF